MKALVLAALFCMTLAVPLAAATPTCESVTRHDATPVEDHYLVVDGTSTMVWHEFNRVAGLQTRDCVDADGGDVRADEPIDAEIAREIARLNKTLCASLGPVCPTIDQAEKTVEKILTPR